MAFGDQDVDVFFLDGTPVTLPDGSTMMAHFDIPEDLDPFGQMRIGKLRDGSAEISGKVTIRYSTAAAPKGFGHGTQVTINGQKYKVRYTQKTDDGLISMAELGL